MARSRTKRARAIVLSKTPLSEKDLILTMLAGDGSQVRAVAKGARKPGARLAGRCDMFCEVDVLIAEGRSLGIVSEADLVSGHAGLRGDPDRVMAASAICDVARATCFEDAADPYLHPICSRALLACEQAQDVAHLDLVVAAYIWKVVAHSGWFPELERCVSCGDEDVSRFSVALGGVQCESCAAEAEGAEPVGPEALSWLSRLLRATFDELLACEVEPHMARWLAQTTHSWAASHLDARLRAVEFMLGL